MRDTTGAGDGSGARIIYGMLNGYNDEELIRIRAAVAAVVYQRFPGVLNGLTEPGLPEFLGVY